MTVGFELEGQEFTAINAGPQFKFNESVSFVIDCKSQEEVDMYWNKLTANGGEESMCGWLKDKFGLSWQVTPTRLIELITDKDAKKSQRAMEAMMKMKKIIIADIEKAAAG
jgi:predicted 3-demethylubiquinone-9 3-methyltransferase (glyoxalase superfamily)